VFGEVILRAVLHYINDFLEEDFTFSGAWYTARWVIALILYYLTVLAIYYMLPNRESSISRLIVKGFWNTIRNFVRAWARNSREIYRMIVPGSIFAAVGMMLATWLYAIYMKYALRNFNILYGGLSSIVILLIWFYLLAFILIIGIQFNAAYAESKKELMK
jgi:membrane protein